MKIVVSNGGQLCNRIWSYIFLIAHSLHSKENIFITDFRDYGKLFPNLSKFNLIHFVKSRFSIFALKKLSYLLSDKFNSWSFITNMLTIKRYNGWDYRSETQFIQEYKKEIKLIFTPHDEVINKCKLLIDPMKNENVVVGVHIRRRDYIGFMKGSYYYEISEYRNFMIEILDEFKNYNSKPLKFLLCSDETITDREFEGIDCFSITNTTPIEDLFGLSLCDFIIAPPSTFSMWASFFGDVPIFIISNRSTRISKDGFKLLCSLDIFTDGTSFTHCTQ